MIENSQAQNPNAGKVVKFTNITNKDFTHAFGGTPFFVKAGETLMFPFDLGRHLAKHLARRIYTDGDKTSSVWDGTDQTGGRGAPLWNDETELAMMTKILGETFQEENVAPKSEVELLKEKVAELQKTFSEQLQVRQPVVAAVMPVSADTGSIVSNQDVAPTTESSAKAVTGELGYQDKAEVIAALKAKNIVFDARQSKAKLETLLEAK